MSITKVNRPLFISGHDVALGDRLRRLEIGRQKRVRDPTRQFRMVLVDDRDRGVVHLLRAALRLRDDGERERSRSTRPSSTKSCRKLRSSLVPSQKILASARASLDLALLLAQQQQAQQRQDRDEDRQRGQIWQRGRRSPSPLVKVPTLIGRK